MNLRSRALLPRAAAPLLLVLVTACGTTPASTVSGTASAAATPVAEQGFILEDVTTYTTWQDSRISESSGLTRIGDALLTVNDQGDAAVIYVSQGASGAVTGTITYAAADPFDSRVSPRRPTGRSGLPTPATTPGCAATSRSSRCPPRTSAATSP